MRKLLALSAVLVGALAIGLVPAGAITDGELDGNGHPYVGLMVAQDAAGNPLWRCSGTLISSTKFLTAGHCTEAPAARAEIWFQSDVESGIPGNGYPFDGQASGVVYTHPQYNPNAFFLKDVGMVVIDEGAVPSGPYPTIVGVGALDSLSAKRGHQNTSFRAVGYGLQESFPNAAAWKENNVRVRMVAYPKLNQINVPGFTGDFSMLLSNNAHTGGTCFGDSGRPNFRGGTNVLAGVTSFGINGNCAGTGGVFRLDKADVHAFIANPSGS